jgi:hypothetical protein
MSITFDDFLKKIPPKLMRNPWEHNGAIREWISTWRTERAAIGFLLEALQQRPVSIAKRRELFKIVIEVQRLGSSVGSAGRGSTGLHGWLRKCGVRHGLRRDIAQAAHDGAAELVVSLLVIEHGSGAYSVTEKIVAPETITAEIAWRIRDMADRAATKDEVEGPIGRALAGALVGLNADARVHWQVIAPSMVQLIRGEVTSTPTITVTKLQHVFTGLGLS